MGYFAHCEKFDNILQLMHLFCIFEEVLNTNNGYFHIEIMISAAHMLVGLCMGTFPPRKFGKCNLVRFDVSLHTILGPPPPDQFLRMLYASTMDRFLAS